MSAQTVDSFPLMGAEATVLAGGDTTGDAWEALQLDLAPGARSPRHTLSADKLFAVVAGTVTVAQIRQIAEAKMKDLSANDIEAAMQIILGSAKSIGIEVKG